MNHLTVIFVLLCFSFSSYCQTETKQKEQRFGVAINSGFSAAAGALSTNPTGIFYINRHQIELGLGLYPLNTRKSKDPRVIGGQLNYKYYPNGIEERFSLYFMAGLTYLYKVEVDAHYHYEDIDHYTIYTEKKYEYLSLLGGYGFDLKIFKKGYIGSCLNFGLLTRSVNVNSTSKKMFKEFGLDAAFRINIGYRF